MAQVVAVNEHAGPVKGAGVEFIHHGLDRLLVYAEHRRPLAVVDLMISAFLDVEPAVGGIGQVIDLFGTDHR